MRPVLRLAAVLALPIAAVAACSSSNSPTSPVTATSIAGTYALVSVEGLSLPAVLDVSNSDTTTVSAGTVRVHANSTWAVNMTTSTKSGGVTTPGTQTDTGTFVVSHDTVTFVSSDQSSTVAVVNGNAVTVFTHQGQSVSTVALLFQKQ